MDFQLAPLRLADIWAVYRLERDIFPQDAYPYLDLAFLILTPGMVNLKAVTPEGKFLGFIAVADVWLPLRPAWVVTLGVAKAAQNQGIGGSLMRAVEGDLRARRIRLTVRKGNAPAIHLYEKLGFQHVYTERRYYFDGEDGLVMEKRLV